MTRFPGGAIGPDFNDARGTPLGIGDQVGWCSFSAPRKRALELHWGTIEELVVRAQGASLRIVPHAKFQGNKVMKSGWQVVKLAP